MLTGSLSHFSHCYCPFPSHTRLIFTLLVLIHPQYAIWEPGTGYVWTGGKNRHKLLSCQRKTDTWGRGIEEKEESIILLLTFKALKWNAFTTIAYKDVIFMCRFPLSAINGYQLISVYLSIVIENRYQSISTQIFAIDWSSIININRYQLIIWYYTLNVRSRGKTKLTGFPRDLTLSVLLYF